GCRQVVGSHASPHTFALLGPRDHPQRHALCARSLGVPRRMPRPFPGPHIQQGGGHSQDPAVVPQVRIAAFASLRSPSRADPKRRLAPKDHARCSLGAGSRREGTNASGTGCFAGDTPFEERANVNDNLPAAAALEQQGGGFLAGGGEMGALIRSHDWTKSPLGTPKSWSPALRMMVGFMLAN